MTAISLPAISVPAKCNPTSSQCQYTLVSSSATIRPMSSSGRDDWLDPDRFPHVGEMIRYRREDVLNMTQEDLEERTGFTQSYISQVETGKIRKPSRTRLARFADALTIPADGLLIAAGHYANRYALFFTEDADALSAEDRERLDELLRKHGKLWG